MTETPNGPSPDLPAAPGGPVSDRMQALLSRAVEEQVSEQRAVSTVLAELRGQVAALGDGVRLTASDASVERLGGVVSTVVADLRTSTSLLGQRIEALSKRVEAVAADTAAPTEQAAVRLAALQADIAAQTETVERMQAALETLSGFPSALAALQKDVAGLHDRIQPLAEIRSTVGDIGARTSSSLEALKPQLDALQTKVDAIGIVPDPERLRDAVVDALGSRLDKLEEAAERPVIGPEVLKSGLGDLRASIDGAMGDRMEDLTAAMGAVENRLGQVGERLSDVGDAAGGVPAISTDLARLAARVEELQGLHDKIGTVGEGVVALREDTTGTALTLGIAALRDDIEHLGERMTETAPPPVEEIAALVSQRVADRLVETLAPRIADVVLTRVSAALVSQLGEALSPRVKADTELVVRTATADSERRVLAHVDEAVLALAEALLRRRRGGRTSAVGLPGKTEEASAPAEPEPAAAEPYVRSQPEAPFTEPVQDIVDKINAVEGPEPEDDEPGNEPHDEAQAVVEAPVLEAPAAAPAPAAEVPAAETVKPSVTTGLAPARPLAAAPTEPAAPAPVVEDATSPAGEVAPPAAEADPVADADEPDAEEPDAEEPVAEEPDAPAEAPLATEPEAPQDLQQDPAPVAAEETAPAAPVVQDAPDQDAAAEEAPAQDGPAEPPTAGAAPEKTKPRLGGRPDLTKRPPAKAVPPPPDPPESLKPAARSKPKPAAPPVKKATTSRPATKPVSKPILDRTPDLNDDDIEPVRGTPPRPRPVSRPTAPTPPPAAPAAEPTGARETGPLSFPAPQTPPSPIARPLPEPKRKPWWRPGG